MITDFIKKIDGSWALIVFVVIGMWNPLLLIFSNEGEFSGVFFYLFGQNTVTIPHIDVSLDGIYTIISFALWFYYTEPEGAFISLIFIYSIPVGILILYALIFGENGIIPISP